MVNTQNDQVLQYLEEFGSITPQQALQDIGCMRLASRIAVLRDLGIAIGRRMVTGKNQYGSRITYAEYYLEENNHA